MKVTEQCIHEAFPENRKYHPRKHIIEITANVIQI